MACDWCDPNPATMECRECGALVIGAMSKPQEDFLATDADIAIYGGGAGGGKTWMLALDAVRDVAVPGYAAILFRRTSPELVGGGSIWEATQKIYRHMGGTPREGQFLDWRFPARSIVECRHLQHESDVHGHQGKQYAMVGFDELTHFTEVQFWYLVSRMRTTCGVKPRLRATCNPDPDSFVRKLVEWYVDPVTGLAIPERSGVVRWLCRRDDDSLDWGDTREEVTERNPGKAVLSFTFIPARLVDNPVLLANDPHYIDKLGSLMRVERERLLGGNWDVKATAGSYFNRSMFEIVDAIDETQVRRRVRGWDKAGTKPNPQHPDPDWTVGPKVAEMKDGSYVVEDVIRLRNTPKVVDDTLRAAASQDGKRCEVSVWQDPGQAGVKDVEHVKDEVLKGYPVRVFKASENKKTYAKMWQPDAERCRIKLVRGPWNEAFLKVLEKFDGESSTEKDDDVDGMSACFMVLKGDGHLTNLREAMRRGANG